MEEQKIEAKEKQTKKKDEPGGLAGSVYMLLHDLLYILGAITIIFVFAIRLVGVKGSSMYPTLVGENQRNGQTYRGDYLALLSNTLCDDYKYGDVVVACVPTFDDGKPIVKRVIATEGQTVSIQPEIDGTYSVWVDGLKLQETYIREPMVYGGHWWETSSVVVPEGCYFCMGDNRNNSHDSRAKEIGMIDGRYIVGKAMIVALPGEDSEQNGKFTFGRIGALNHG